MSTRRPKLALLSPALRQPTARNPDVGDRPWPKKLAANLLPSRCQRRRIGAGEKAPANELNGQGRAAPGRRESVRQGN
ncbi:hypothetical protein NEOLEDRAFT_1132989 [Neolentinus lepideus HHB14362 ss-1]|uniref:Uncharacterized protein n=1 Tax=Neolentinus lepideus HHB14362 ss-1 TaxID=1314782 RepID=A0A165T054_9AGAM|nr:hypothetical protein NEOLEDRAFT_1132989 [Neolentinus lepideus HHB14362 ss-1]